MEDILTPSRAILDDVDEGLKVVEKVVDRCPRSCLFVEEGEINKQKDLWTEMGDVRFNG
jgi:hypothetical protein